MDAIKYGIGIDISKSTFTVSISVLQKHQEIHLIASEEFENVKKGFNQLLRWVKKNILKDVEVFYVMEATGVYYEHLAYHLHHLDKKLHVALPSKIKYYFKSLNVKSKTDLIDSQILAQYACERKHNQWNPPKEVYLKLRALTRYQDQLKRQLVVVKNRLHSKECAYQIPKEIIKQEKRLIKELEKLVESCLKQIAVLIASDEELKAKNEKLLSIKGAGQLTVAVVIAETLGFQNFYNKKQLTSYAGFDVVYRESGTSVYGRTRISKKGNRRIRKALYFPSLVAARYNSSIKTFYERIVEKKKIKKVALTASGRKLLELMYTLWKTDQFYIENYEQTKTAPRLLEAELDIS